MNDIRSKVNEIYSMEQLAGGDSRIHRLHPDVKILATIIYIVCAASLGRYDLAGLSPFLFYPAFMISLAGLPAAMILRRSAAALPFVLFAGASNLIFDTGTAGMAAGIPITAGFLSFLVLLFRSFLCVSAVLILTAVTPFADLTDSLRRIHVPELVVTLIEMVYRFCSVLVGEASQMLISFRLRSGGSQWPDMGLFIPFIGQLFLRSADRSERVFHAMQCRGGGIRGARRLRKPFGLSDLLFLAAAGGSSLIFRFCHVAQWIGGFFV